MSENKETWTIQKLINWTAYHFASKKIESSRLDGEILLAYALKCKRLDLYLNLEKPLKPEELDLFRGFVKRRAQREPVAYITGAQEFYGKPFSVGPGVLIPRPETEHLIDEVVSYGEGRGLKNAPIEILDIGSGSGCIGITLATEFTGAEITAVEISDEAVKYSLKNAENLFVSDRFVVERGDFEQVAPVFGENRFQIVASNPPYIGRNGESALSPDVAAFEPAQALFGGAAGHELTERWIPFMIKILKPGGLLVFEIGFDQGAFFEGFLKSQKNIDEVQIKKDYSGHTRVAQAIKKIEG